MEFLFAPAALAFMMAFLVGSIVLIARAERRRQRLERAWGSYAARRDYRFEEGPTIDRPFRIGGTHDDLSFVLETERSSRGTVTRVVAPAPHRSGRVVAALGRCRRDEGLAPATTGERHFDRLFEVRASSDEAAAWLAPAVRVALQRFPLPMTGAGLRLEVADERAVVEWVGDDANAHTVEAGLAVLRSVVAAPK